MWREVGARLERHSFTSNRFGRQGSGFGALSFVPQSNTQVRNVRGNPSIRFASFFGWRQLAARGLVLAVGG